MYYNLISYTEKVKSSKFFGLVKSDENLTKKALQEIDENGYVTRFIDLEGNEIIMPEVYESNIIEANYKFII